MSTAPPSTSAMEASPIDPANRTSCQKYNGKYKLQSDKNNYFITAEGSAPIPFSKVLFKECDYPYDDADIVEPIIVQDRGKVDNPGLMLGTWIRRTLEDLQQTFLEHRHEWEESSSRQQLEDQMSIICNDTYITKVVGFAISSLQHDAPGAESARRRSNYELAALLTIIACINKGRDASQRVRCFMQEPILTVNDEKILASYGIKVVDDPEGYEAIDNGTLVWMHGAYAEMYHRISKGPWPAAWACGSIHNYATWCKKVESDGVTAGINVTTGINEEEALSIEDMASHYEHQPFPDYDKDTLTDVHFYWNRSKSDDEKKGKR